MKASFHLMQGKPFRFYSGGWITPEDAVSRWLLQMRLSCDMEVAWSRLEASKVPESGSLRCCCRGFRHRRLWGQQWHRGDDQPDGMVALGSCGPTPPASLSGWRLLGGGPPAVGLLGTGGPL